MKIPRDTSGAELAKSLSQFGYQITRQKGSHMRLTTQQNGEHHIVIPHHAFVRLGTLHSILKEVALHHNPANGANGVNS